MTCDACVAYCRERMGGSPRTANPDCAGWKECPCVCQAHARREAYRAAHTAHREPSPPPVDTIPLFD